MEQACQDAHQQGALRLQHPCTADMLLEPETPACSLLCSQTIDALIDGMQPEEDVDDRDVQARVNCTRALGAVCRTLMTPAATPGAAQPPLATGKAVELLHNKVQQISFQTGC